MINNPMEPNKDREGVEGLEESIIDAFAKDFFSANCTCGAFHATKLKRFIKERFVYKPDLIALVEGKKNLGKEWLEMMEAAKLAGFSNMKSPQDFIDGRNHALNDILATLSTMRQEKGV